MGLELADEPCDEDDFTELLLDLATELEENLTELLLDFTTVLEDNFTELPFLHGIPLIAFAIFGAARQVVNGTEVGNISIRIISASRRGRRISAGHEKQGGNTHEKKLPLDKHF